MDTSATIARQGAVMAIIADLIVAAATDQTLRVAVCSTHPDETAFADRLTRALRDRGRDCRYRTPTAMSITTDRYPPAHSEAGKPTVAVITGGAPGPDDGDLCRINIRLHTPIQVTASVGSAHSEPDRHDQATVGGHEPDIIVDCHGPGGLTIRHLGPVFTAQPDHHGAGPQPDRRPRLP
jgi:hypothetical protein